MSKRWRAAIFGFMGLSFLTVLVWTGLLAYRWFEANRLGKLIILDACAEEHPMDRLYRSATPSEWRPALIEFESRQGEVHEKLTGFAEWQRHTALAAAFDAWQACDPRPRFGTLHFWNLLHGADCHEFAEQMLDAPLPQPRGRESDWPNLFNHVARLSRQARLPIHALSPEQALAPDSHEPIAGRRFRDELDAFAASNGLRWERFEQLLVLGSADEIGELHRRSGARERRLKLAADSSHPASQKVAKKFTELVTLEFVETPFGDVLDFLRELTGLNIVLLSQPPTDPPNAPGAQIDHPVNLYVEEIPLGLALDCMLMPAGLDWSEFDGVIALGTAEQLAGFERRVQRRVSEIGGFRSLASASKGTINHKLGELVTLEFVETPLRDVNVFLTELTGFPSLALTLVQDADGVQRLASRESLVTIHVEQVALATALDWIAERTGIDWSLVNDCIVFAEPEPARLVEQWAEETERKLASVPARLASALHGHFDKRVVYVPKHAALAVVAEEFRQAHLPIEYAPEDAACSADWHVGDLLLYRELSVFCLLAGLDWEPTASGAVRVFPRDRLAEQKRAGGTP